MNHLDPCDLKPATISNNRVFSVARLVLRDHSDLIDAIPVGADDVRLALASTDIEAIRGALWKVRGAARSREHAAKLAAEKAAADRRRRFDEVHRHAQAREARLRGPRKMGFVIG